MNPHLSASSGDLDKSKMKDFDPISNLVLGKSLSIFNTLSRKKEEFQSIRPGEASIYSCGPTVYSDAHIGNLRSYVFPDVLKKTLGLVGYDVRHVINITDVGHLTDDASEGDDKMELSAKKRNETVWDISKRYTDRFVGDLDSLNIEPPNLFTKATDYIGAQIEMVEGLEKKGFTYRIADGVYFDTSKFSAYPEFARLDVENLNEGERVDFGEKRNKTDFALWKFSPKTETKRQMEWDSPWGVGFPGWHIECSAMTWKELGDRVDIHTGGSDHIPVHHTNEIAQGTCFHGHAPVNYWMHGEFLVLDKNKRIGKSEGNSITLNSLIEGGFDPLSYRYLVLMAHYRSFLTFSEEILSQAQAGLVRLRSEIKRISETAGEFERKALSQEGVNAVQLIMNCLLDDLNTPMAIVALRETMKNPDISAQEKIMIIEFFDEVFSLNLLDFSYIENASKDIPQDILEKAELRWKLKSEKAFREADEIRKDLEKQGYKILDSKSGFEVVRI